MILTFEKALELTDTISTRAAYQIEALRGLWLAVTSIPPGSVIVEIGLEYGRSSSLLLQVAKEMNHSYIGIDPFIAEPILFGPPQIHQWVGMAQGVGHPYTVCVMESLHARFNAPIGLLHIDGCHEGEPLKTDISMCLLVQERGYVVLHDYDGPVTPEVKMVADDWLKDWERIGVYDTCAVFRRPGV